MYYILHILCVCVYIYYIYIVSIYYIYIYMFLSNVVKYLLILDLYRRRTIKISSYDLRDQRCC